MISLFVSARAARQALDADQWWQDHSEQPALFRDEFQTALDRLILLPLSGAPYGEPGAPPEMRRILLRRTQHHIYYCYDPARAELTVHAVWATRRRPKPRLL